MKPVTDPIPEHLLPFISSQDMSQYTAINHATWRYTLRIARNFFKKHAHEKYLSGLKLTGISIDQIPSIDDMDRKLRAFGWRAVPVSGFIPPAIFMEFQSLGILPIACDMRSVDHLAYTPAPDIIHEAAGHAPILADEEYAQYLRRHGEVAKYAIFSKQDLSVYEAIRHLSDIKENPNSAESDITAAQKQLDTAITQQTYVSEASYLARMNWWTAEYGLVGSLKDPKIFGAGLLSSVGESAHCLSDQVMHVPFSLDCINTSYDITRPQPQLFVTPDFPTLTNILESFAKTMAYRTGGLTGLAKAILSESVCTIVLDGALQVSGILHHLIEVIHSSEPAYLKFRGPCQVSFQESEIEGQSATDHAEGFGLPLGLPQQWSSPSDIDQYPLKSKLNLTLSTGVHIEGTLVRCSTHDKHGRIATLEPAKVTYQGEVLFDPQWGPFDWVIGAKVTSVFGGAADRAAYLKKTGGLKVIKKPHLKLLDPSDEVLNTYFERTAQLRAEGATPEQIRKELSEIAENLIKHYPKHWLCHMELIELDPTGSKRSREHIQTLCSKDPEIAALVNRGLELL